MTLGVHPPILLGLGDGSLGHGSQFSELHYLLDSILSSLKPKVVITWDLGGYYGHIDHRMVSNVVTELYQEKAYLSQSRLFYFGVPPWEEDVMDTLSTPLAKGLVNGTLSTRKSLFTHKISWSQEDLNAVRAALSCHRSQFTQEEMADLFFLNTKDNVTYLRSAFATEKNGSTLLKD